MEPIFTEDDYQQNKGLLRDIEEAIREGEKGIRAGLPLQTTVSQLQEQKARLIQFNAVYFPGR